MADDIAALFATFGIFRRYDTATAMMTFCPKHTAFIDSLPRRTLTRAFFHSPRMNPRVLEILDRLDAIDLARGELCAEELVLRTELREILEGRAEENDDVDFSMFKETTRRLLIELWDAPEKMISHQDIREDVIFDEEASDQAVKNVIVRARYELAEAKAKFDIKNVFGKGYQLVPKRIPKVPKRRKSLKRKE